MRTINKNDVIVITGASTGIGRATAIEFAKRLTHVVLVARQVEKLEEVALECQRVGASYTIKSLDVTDAEAVSRLAVDVFREQGRLDVWVNNAGVGVVGSFTDVPIGNHRRVIETNVLGYMFGAHAALKIFKQQGHGVLINNASVSSRLATPNLGSYTASKFAIRGLTHSLQQDLKFERQKNIYVCQVNPTVVDTPAFHHTANYSGQALNIKFPMVTAEQVARAIVKLVEHPKQEVFVGHLARLGSLAYTFFPGLTSEVLAWATRKYYHDSNEKRPPSSGNLFKPVKDDSSTTGGWKSGKTSQV